MKLFDAFYLASGIVFIALGILLIVGRRRHPPAVALALYVLGLGLMYTTSVIWRGSGVETAGQIALGFLAAAGLGMFAFLFPRRLTGRGILDGAGAAAYGLGFILLLGWLYAQADDSVWRGILGASGAGSVLSYVSANIVAIVSVAAWILLPLRARRLDATEGKTMRTLGVLAAAYLLVSPGGPFPGIVAAARGDAPFAHAVMSLLATLLVQSLWLLSTLGPHRRAARNIILILVGLTLGLGALHQAAGGLVVPIGRLFSALVLAYAVVAGQIEGLDVKVRWGISRSTIAAAFVTVFFVASEGAQIVFGSDDPWVGLVAAGALVFAIAPLQRAAERLAESAVPSTSGATPSVAATKEADSVYEAALRAAAREGAWTRREEQHLAEIAETLGIGPKRALQLRQRIEEELGARI